MTKNIISEKFEKFLEIKNYSECTIKTYCNALMQFLEYFHEISPTNLTQKHLDEFINSKKFTSTSQQNQFYSSLKLFYRYILKTKITKVNLERPRREKKLPQIIEKEYLLNCIANIQNLKHKAIISLAYSVGLRVSEVINLKIEDIDSKRMILFILEIKPNDLSFG